MSEPSDQQLLSAWAGRHDEAAFRALLGRYAGFVYGAIQRRVGDAGLAEEIAQDVFARLSQHAGRLSGHPTIAGWLHRSAMLLALDRLRRRARQARTLQKFAQMTDTPGAPDPWAEVLPHLDDALDHLGAREREVLMLHFAERRTFPQIAEHLGSTPDAIRMRTNRALAELSRILTKKRAAIPATALAAGLGGTFAQAAPASLASIAPAALAGMGEVSAISVIVQAIETTKTAKVIVGGAVAVVLSIPLVLQQNQISAAETHLAALQRSQVLASTDVPSNPTSGAVASAKAEDESFDLKKLAEDALADDYFATRRVRRVASRLNNSNLTGLIETALHSGLMPAPRNELLRMLLLELKGRDTALYLEWAMKVPAEGQAWMEAQYTFRDWMAAQPSQAAAWANANMDEWKQFGGVSLSTLATAGLLRTDPARAYATLEKSSVAECMDILGHASRTLSLEQTTALAKWASSLADVEKRRRLVRKALWITPQDAPSGAYLEWIRPTLLGLSLNDDDLTWVAVRLALDSGWVESDLQKVPTAQLEWIEGFLPADRLVYAQGALGHAFNPNQALIFLNAEFDKSPDDDLIAGYVESEDMRWHRDGTYAMDSGRHGETAFRLATRVQDPRRRANLLTRAWNDLLKDSEPAAQAILAIPELKPGDRAAVLTQARMQLQKNP